jgi:hypothetical protein
MQKHTIAVKELNKFSAQDSGSIQMRSGLLLIFGLVGIMHLVIK